MNKRTKMIVIIFCVSIFLWLSMAGISAYFISTDTATNILTIGGNSIEITEDFPTPDPEPGSSHRKVVQITNTGTVDCYVRVFATFSNSDMGDYCTVDWNTSDWIYDEEDGYWYYKRAITTGEKTPALFTLVSISSEISEEEMKDFDIIIYAESIQSMGFEGYQNAWDEFQKNKSDNFAYNTVSMKSGLLKSRISCSESAIKSVVFTDSPAPSGVNLDNLSANGYNSVVGWLDSGTGTYFISSQRSGYVILAPSSCYSLFEGLTKVETFDFTNFDASQITNAMYMFNGCTSLKTLDLSNWNIQSIEYMGGMFGGCTTLTTVDMSNWNTSKLLDIDEAFDSCSSLKSVDFTGWETPKLEDITYLFKGCKSLVSLDLSSWDVSSISESNFAFSDCTAVIEAIARTQTDADILNAIVQKCSTTSKPLNWEFSAKR